MLHRFGKSQHLHQHAVLRRTTGLRVGPLRASSTTSAAKAAPKAASSSTATATASSSASAATAARPHLTTTVNGLFRATHQTALHRLFSTSAARAAPSASASASTSSAASFNRFKGVGSALAAATLVAAGVAVSQSQPAKADGAAAAGGDAVLAPAMVGVPAGAARPADTIETLPAPSGPVSLKARSKAAKSGGKKPAKKKGDDDDEVRIDPVAPTWQEVSQGARHITEVHTWNGVDLKFAYSPLPHVPQDLHKEKEFSMIHHIALGSPLSKEEEPTATYDLTGLVALGIVNGEPSTTLQAKVSEGGVEGMARTTFFRNHPYFYPYTTQLQFLTSGEDNQPVAGAIETNYMGRGWTVDLSYRLRPSVGQVAFIQNIPVKDWKCALGTEFGHAFDSQNSALSYAGSAKRGAEAWGFSLQGSSYSILSYSRRFGEPPTSPNLPPSSLVTLGTDVHYDINSHIALLNVGVAYQLPGMFTAKAAVNTNQQIASSLESMLGPAITFALCSDVKHTENKYAFGMSLSFGGG